MSEEENPPPRFSKEWIREEWDEEHDTAPKEVQLAKIVHEWHIALPGTLLGLIAVLGMWYLGQPLLETAGTFCAFFAGGYARFYSTLWCSTLAE
ncbi:hypothetical protein [Halolamina salifodinae]|uniref:Uncharacterized protein n=1 Tax=Halolamina salifodinae TaxID=1202767 RepID=A0A8T4GU96_9EURY|nr:hypothetical protein [Halolamina salifodinae]MBP1985970.1 hypothetical protein [Halolamina salifodinae]